MTSIYEQIRLGRRPIEQLIDIAISETYKRACSVDEQCDLAEIDPEEAPGSSAVIRYLEREPGLDPWEAATDAITDILHAYCGRGDELEAEELTRRAVGHFVRESDGSAIPAAGRELPMDAEGILYEDRDVAGELEGG